MNRKHSIARGVALVIVAASVGCNLVTGASDLFTSDEADGAAPDGAPVDPDATTVQPDARAAGDARDAQAFNEDDADGDPPVEVLDSGSDAYTPPLEASANGSFLRVFMTSTTTPGNFGGVLQADLFCQNRANTSGLGGTWRAWLGVAGAPPSQHIQGSGPWRLLDGTIIANSRAQLLGGTLIVPISRNEKNLAMSGHIHVWSGATAPGTTAANTCLNWLSTSGSGYAGYNTSAVAWTNHINASCTASNRFYCFEQ